MFCNKTSFSEEAVFLEKTTKTHLWEDMNVLRGGESLATKISVTFFCKHRRFEYFSFNNFFEKNNIFQNNSEKLFLGAWPFLSERVSDNKNEYNFFFRNGVFSSVLKFFSQKTPIPSDLNPKNWFWEHIFPHICGSIGPIVSKNNRVHPWVDLPHQLCKFHENWFKIATCIVTSYIYINIADFVIRGLQNKKHDHPHLPHSPLLLLRVSEWSLFRSEISLKTFCEAIL